MNKKEFSEEIVKFLPQRLKSYFEGLTEENLNRLQEIRLRIDRPLNLIFSDADLFLGKAGLKPDPAAGEVIKKDDLVQAMLFLSNHSIYALDEELRQGFITIPGGHRVGFVGYGVIKEGALRQIKEFSGLNFRVTRELSGCATRVLPLLFTREGELQHTMIVSPPRCGKTTILRDLIRQLSSGSPHYRGMKVGVVDERSELAGSYGGIPRHDLGVRTDILDHCPKSEGMYLLIRSMSPEVIATDEIGSATDVEAIKEAVNAGIRLVTTVHGRDLKELSLRPILRELLACKIFTRFVVLSSPAGTVAGVYDEKYSQLLSLEDLKTVKERVMYG